MGTPIRFVAPWDLDARLAVFQGDGPLVFVESRQKGRALPWHRQKLALVLSAQRHFVAELRAQGREVWLLEADSYADGIRTAAARHGTGQVVLHRQRDWGIQRSLEALELSLGWLDDGGEGGHFLLTRQQFADWAGGQKTQTLRMDSFYRWMRRHLGILLEDGDPVGGRWSFDADNRKAVKGERPPSLPHFPPDETTRELLDKLEGIEGLWGRTANFDWPVTRAQALEELVHFTTERLGRFGDFQDALVQGETFLWHSRLAPAMNLSLLHPQEVVEAVLAADAPLNAVEGFVRQVIGWREFIRGVYWQRMPEMRDANALDASRPLPRMYWEPEESELACVQDAVRSVRDHGYAHHIQRLMVLGNFALLAGVAPLELSHWFWAGFVDAQEWVELPNVHGMALYADPGFTTKPYAASGAYLNKMGDHCKRCRYDVKQRTGADACPFNPLFWHFMSRNAERLRHNGRMAQLLRTWERWDEAHQQEILSTAEAFLDALPPSEHGWSFADDAG